MAVIAAKTERSPAPTSQSNGGPVTSLRDWLDRLGTHGRLAVIRPDVSLQFELAAIAKRLDGKSATLFPRPGGHLIPVVSGLISNRGWMAEAMGVPQARVLQQFQDAALNPLPWKEVSSAPVQEVVHRTVDLGALLPIPQHNEHDSGAYITAGLVIVRNPATGIQNVAIHRLQLTSGNRLGALLLPRHTLGFYRIAEENKQDLDVAVVIGVDPLTLLSSQAIVPQDYDELGIAGALHGRSLEVVKCTSSEIRVPAHAEIVLEGRILAQRREPEGPFGEFPQYYGERADRHVIEIDRVTHRRKPLFHTIVGGGLEHLLLGGIPREATLLAHLQRSFPGVRDVHLSRGGVCRYHLYVQMRKQNEGEAKNVMLGAFAGHYDVKHVVVVDEDVNIHDPAEVEWAIATRSQADRDVIIIPETQASRLDPSTRDGIGAKMGIDATVPLDAPEFRFKRIRVPGENEVDLEAVVEAGAGRDWRRWIE